MCDDNYDVHVVCNTILQALLMHFCASLQKYRTTSIHVQCIIMTVKNIKGCIETYHFLGIDLI